MDKNMNKHFHKCPTKSPPECQTTHLTKYVGNSIGPEAALLCHADQLAASVAMGGFCMGSQQLHT